MLTLVHYTDAHFKLHPIIIRNGGNGVGLSIKPRGGLWCSPDNSSYGWRDWCRDEEYSDIDNQHKVLLVIDTSNIVVIDNANDMSYKLIWLPIHRYSHTIDFESMVQRGIDGIHLTVEGQYATRLTYPKSLYGWDCETILLLNDRCIKEVIL